VTNADFFASKKAAAVFKHGILSRYPVVFAAKTGRTSVGKRVVFLDGYAGKGEYDDGQPGSPLLLSRCADFVASFRDAQGFFVEQDPDNYANLVRVLDEKGGSTKRVVRHGSLDEHLSEALQFAAGAPLFAFLDPFGPALDFNRIKDQLLARPKWPPTEVLLHFSVISVARLGSAVHKAREQHGKLREQDCKSADRLNRFLGGEWWQDEFAAVRGEGDEERASNIAMRVGQFYEERLLAGTRYKAIRMPVRPRPDLLPKYVLVLLTANPDGAWHFADALGKAGVEWSVAWQQEEERRFEERMGEEATLFSFTADLTAKSWAAEHAPGWSKIIAGNLDRLLDRYGPFRPEDRVPEVYGTTLGQAGIPHVRAAVKALKRDQRVANTGTGDFWEEQLRRT
jgi:three-Cys-motif partner protein